MRHTDVLVVGAGPAGIRAATAAAKHGRRTILLDDNHSPGGQIWRAAQGVSSGDRKGSQKSAAIQALRVSGAEVLSASRVFDVSKSGVVRAVEETAEGTKTEEFTWQNLILATGARELFLPFPGWTIPGVFGVGGLEALVKGGFDVAGKRVVIAGTGPLLLAAGAHLADCDAKIVLVAEQAPLSGLIRFGASLSSDPSKLIEGIHFLSVLGRAAYKTGCWVTAVERNAGNRGPELTVRLTDGKQAWSETCDYLACGFHLAPNTELASLIGCRLRDGFVEVDARQQTSVAGVLCAGEPTGIAGVDSALIQGEIAGLVAAAKISEAERLFGRRDRYAGFRGRLEAAFQLRNELRELPADDTIVCRCEDVRYAQLKERRSWRDAKLGTRCGMGPCQGRICGPAVKALFGWEAGSVRPPLFPVPFFAMEECASPVDNETENQREMG